MIQSLALGDAAGGTPRAGSTGRPDRAKGPASEFHYGSLMRTVALPAGAMEASATATYAQGILEVSFGLGEPTERGRHIAIQVARDGPRTKR